MENEEAFVDGNDLRSASGEVCVPFVKVLNGKKTNNVAITTQKQPPTLLLSCFVTYESKKRSENRWYNV